MEEKDIESALRLATMWSFNSVRNELISRLSRLSLAPARRLELARAHNISNWFIPALRELVAREDGLTVKEAEMLGFSLTHLFGSLRDIRYRIMMNASKTVTKTIYTGRVRRERTFYADATVTGREIAAQSASEIERAIDIEIRKFGEIHGWTV